MKNAIVLILLCVLAVSCSVQKRKYQKGYYMAWHRSAAPEEKKERVKAARQNNAVTNAALPGPEIIAPGKAALADGSKRIAPVVSTQSKISLRAEPDSCDEITFRNGDVNKAKISEISTDELKYRRCDMADGPLYVVKKSEIFMVKYANGTKEVFPVEPVSQQRSAERPMGRIRHPDAPLVLILGLTGIFLYYGSIHAIILGTRVLREIRAEPGRYSGEDMVKAGIALGIFKLLLVLFVVVLLLGFLL